MDYSKFIFNNKPSVEEILKGNVFIYGPTGSGKSVLLHQILDEISKFKNLDDYEVYVQDGKLVEFREKDYPFVKEFINDSNEKEVAARILEEKEDKKRIIIFDDICCSNIEEWAMDFYKHSKKSNAVLIIASQLKDVYYRNQQVLDNFGSVWFIEGGYDNKDRTINIVK